MKKWFLYQFSLPEKTFGQAAWDADVRRGMLFVALLVALLFGK